MIRAFLDSNVIVAAIAGRSEILRSVIDRWRADEYELVLSEYVLGEAEDAWLDPYWRVRLSDDSRQDSMGILRNRATIVADYPVRHGIASHIADDDVLSAAIAASVDYLVTRDKELRLLSGKHGIEIVSPSEFLEKLEACG